MGSPWGAKGGALGSRAAPIGSQEVPNRVEIDALGVYFVGPVDLADFDDSIVRNQGFRCPEGIQIRRVPSHRLTLERILARESRRGALDARGGTQKSGRGAPESHLHLGGGSLHRCNSRCPTPSRTLPQRHAVESTAQGRHSGRHALTRRCPATQGRRILVQDVVQDPTS